MNVLIGYGANAHLGLLHGMNKLVPALRGGGEIERLESVKDSVFWFNILLGAIAAIATFVASYNIPVLYAAALRIVSAIIFVQMLFNYLFCLLRSESKFVLVSNGMAVSAGLSTVLVLMFAYIYPDRLYGALWGLLAANILAVIYWLIASGYKFAHRVRMADIGSSFRLGFPLIVLGLIDMCLFSVDRWVIASQLEVESLGYYAIAVMAVNIFGLAAVSVSNVLFPRMVEKFAENKHTIGTENLLLKPLSAIAAAMIMLIFVASITLPLFIKVLLPKYIPSLPLLDVMMPAAFFLSLAAIAGTYTIAINKQTALIGVQIFALISTFALDWFFIKHGYGIVGIAYGTFLGYMIHGLGYTCFSIYFATRKGSESAIILFRLIVPFAIMLMVFFLANKAGVLFSIESWSLRLAMIKFGFSVVLFFPVFWMVHGKGDLFQLVQTESAHFLKRGKQSR